MAGPILATKLYIPTPNDNTIPRERLRQRLTDGVHRKVTLVSAPAGFGKTTLITSWIASREAVLVAWVSLDEQDSNTIQFLNVLAAGFQTIVPSFKDGVMLLFDAPQLPPTSEILTRMLNELTVVPHQIVLVLDDYHLVDSEGVDTAVTFFIDHLPPNLHLIMTTREDPQLPLSRYRGRGQMNEFRAADLRFTLEEAVHFFNDGMGVTLSKEDVSVLDARTEGWIAGLQMAALSLYGRSDTTHFVQAFKGSHRYVLDYLVDEVLNNQIDEVRDFLLKTAVLGRFNASLCNAVVQQENSHTMLNQLERQNLFLIPLDDDRQWYRYHHLFADMLKTHVQNAFADEMFHIHQRASQWFEAHDFIHEAVEHALLGQDYQSVANLCEIHWPVLYRNFQNEVWHRWVDQLPPSMIENRPLLAVGLALSSLDKGKLADAQSYLSMAEKWTDKLSDPSPEAKALVEGLVVSDETQFSILPATVATTKAALAQANQDEDGIFKNAKKALLLLPEDQYSGRVLPFALLGLTHFSHGELEQTYYYFSQVQRCFFNEGDIYWGLGPTRILANIRILQGRIREAQILYEEALETASTLERSVFPGLAELYLGLGEVAFIRGDLETAVIQKEKAKNLGNATIVPGNHYRLFAFMAEIEEALGHFDEAMRLLDEAERSYFPTYLHEVKPIQAVRARLLLKNGRLEAAQQLLARQEVVITNPSSFVYEYPNLTAVMIKIESDEEESPLDLIQFLKQLKRDAEQGGRQLRVIESLILLSLAAEKTNDAGLAQDYFSQALQLAKIENCVQPFVVFGERLEALFKSQQQDLSDPQLNSLIQSITSKRHHANKPLVQPQPLLDPLSKRELEILQLISQGLSNKEICDQLYLALNTVKGHNHRIFSKLQVQRRTEAVARARELGLIA